MALQSQTISVPFNKGLDTKTDPKLSLKLSDIRNMVFSGGTLVKRHGFSQLTNQVDQGFTFAGTGGEALFAYDNELVHFAAGRAYGLSSTESTWVTKSGRGYFANITNQRIQRSSRSQTQCDQAYCAGYSVFAWVEAAAPQQGIHIAVLDEASGSWIQTGATAVASSSAGFQPRCVTVGTKVFVVWSNSTNIDIAVVNTASPAVFPTSAHLVTSLSSTLDPNIAGFDLVPFGSAAVLVWLSTTTYSDSLAFVNVTAAGATTGSTTTFTHVTDGSYSKVGAMSAVVANNQIFVVYSDSAVNHNYFMVVDSSFGVVLAKTAIGSLAISSIGLADLGSGVVLAVFGGFTSATANLAWSTLGNAGVLVGPTDIPGSHGLALQSAPAKFAGQSCIAVSSTPRGGGNTVSTQPTAFVIDLTGNVIAKMLPGTCGTQAARYRLANVTSINGTLNYLYPERSRLSYSSNSGFITDKTPMGVTRVTLKGVSGAVLPIQRIGDTVYVGGARPSVYDGQQLIDTGFSQFPEGLAVSLGSSGSLSTGSYQWKVLYSWVDARGQLVRSAASPPVTASATSTQKATVVATTLPLSTRDLLPQGVTVQMELYRTEANGTVFYRANAIDTPSYNLLNAKTVNIVDGLADADLLVGELLYAQGGVLDWLAPPAYSIATTHKERLIIAGLEDPYEWRSSSTRIPGEQVRFNEVWGGRVPAATGKITGLASQDGNLLIFTTGAAYAIMGDGPDLLGNNSWPSPQLITSVDAGATTPQSVISTSAGVFFQSPRGIKLLDRGLNCHYIGADVEAFTGASGAVIRCATVRPEVEQVWFHLDLGTDTTVGSANALVYDWRYQQWSVQGSSLDTYGFGAQSACYSSGLYTRITSDGTIWQETTGYKDNGHTYTSIVETEWIKLAGLQGFQRVYRAGILGTNAGPSTITMVCRSDYQGSVADETVTFDTSTLAASAPLQFRHHLANQKTEAVRFKLSDAPANLTIPTPDTFLAFQGPDRVPGGPPGLGAGAYWYRVSAFNALGETLASAEQSSTVDGSSTNGITVRWFAVPGATGYNIYGRSFGSEGLLSTVNGGLSTNYSDLGADTPSTLPPSAAPAVFNGQGMSLTDLTLTIGIKSGQFKLPAAKTI